MWSKSVEMFDPYNNILPNTKQNVYNFGKKKKGKAENTISKEKLKEMKDSLGKILSRNEQ